MNGLGSVLISACDGNKKDIACVLFNGQERTYGELLEDSETLGRALRNLNLTSGSNIGIFLPNGWEYMTSYLATQLIGCRAVLIPAYFKRWELERIKEQCHLKGIITTALNFSLMKECGGIKGVSALQSNIILVGFAGTTKSTLAASDNKSVAVIIPTSGSLDQPKAVMLSPEGILFNALAYARHLGLKKTDSCLVVLPLTSAFSHTTQMIAHLLLGGTLVFGDRLFLGRGFLDLVTKRKPSITGLVATMLTSILSDVPDPFFSSLKKVVLAGAPITKSVTAMAARKLPGVQLIKAYGLTEAGPRVAQLLPDESQGHEASVGKPLPGTSIDVIDEKENRLPYGKTGEIRVKSPSLMVGYYQNEKLTGQVINKGWLKTGDIGFIEPSGHLYILGRSKNVIIKNGLKIYPEELEEFLCSQPFVSEAVVSAVKTKEGPEKVVARIVLQNGAKINLADLVLGCRGKISAYKIPDEFILVDRIDKNPSGKIQRTLLSRR